MHQRLFGFAVVALLLASLVPEARAQAFHVGFTDHELIIANMPEYKDVQQQLQEEYQGSQATLQALMDDYQGKVERYQKQQALLSEERRTQREDELRQAQQDIQDRAKQSDQQLAEREAELLSPIFAKVDAAIKDVAKANNLDLVLRSQAGPMQPIILYVNPETVVDITPQVASKLGLKVEEEPQASNN